ncbi:LPD38 domain-containing protein [Microbulbifer sp. 2205BS26-8]|uniref:LPD38 domain-containing protein n=1 Tax=Microbulbifer sp. 2205BS26-8 TaxID=3064386 RepID=UPI0035308EE6
MAFSPWPQVVNPIRELQANRNFHFDKPIESLGDQRKLPKDRYNSFTSDTMVSLAQVVGWSPKQMEHFWVGYTGTMGPIFYRLQTCWCPWRRASPIRGSFWPRTFLY